MANTNPAFKSMSIILFASISRPCYCYLCSCILCFDVARTRIRILPTNILHIRATAIAKLAAFILVAFGAVVGVVIIVSLWILESNDASDHVLMVRNLWKNLQRFIGIQTYPFYIRLGCVQSIYLEKEKAKNSINNNYIQLIDHSAIF